MNYEIYIDISGIWLKDESGVNHTIQDIIKNTIRASDLTIYDVARNVKVDVDTIYRIINKGQQTSYQTMFKILNAIGIKITMAVCL